MLDTKENFLAIHHFVEYWRGQGGVEINPVGNGRFEALVSYNSRFGTQNFRTNVRLMRSGYDDGKILLEEKGELVAEAFHLDFSARWQGVRFHEETNSLIVTGSSDKMGQYQVQITPIA